jgi:peptidyl-prolyl cis-trans isomerase B (cyclophilin B)
MSMIRTAAPSLVVLALAAAAVPAQDTPAQLMLELERNMPRKMPSMGEQLSLPTPEEWDALLEKIGSILVRAQGTPVEPHAMLHLGNVLFATGRLDEARETLLDLKQRFPDHPLVRVRIDPEVPPLVEQVLRDCEEEIVFRSKYAVEPLPRPELDPGLAAVLHFNVGNVRIRFYRNVAPQHRDNFLKLARSGFYDLTRVHMVVPGVSASLGDPNSKTLNATEWGRGGPGYDLEPEFSLVQHRRGTVTAWRQPGLPRSHGSQFQVIFADQPHLDFLQVPFAQVVEGLDVLETVTRQTRNQYLAPAQEVILTGITIQEGR